MRNKFDHLAKELAREALGPSGPTVVHDEISPETQHADLRHEPHPAHKAERARLGLLGRLASVRCLIEIYGHAFNAEELRACLTKHFAFWQQGTRKARADNKRRKKRKPPEAFAEPFLWIITAGAPTAIMTKLKLEPAWRDRAGTRPPWPEGVYLFGGDALRVGIVVASELPRDRSTLLVRLMAAGPLLKPAIEDLRRLPEKAHERFVAERILLRLRNVLQKKPTRTRKEQEFIVTMNETWEDARAEGRAVAVLTVLQERGIVVPAAARKRILAQKGLKQLERWLKKAIVATSVDDVIGSRS